MHHAPALGQIVTEVLDGAFLFCADCTAVHRITRSDRAPIYLADGSQTAADDMNAFLYLHGKHRLQLLRRSSDAEVISHPRWDPMCRVAWEVSDGETYFVVSFGRSGIETPREYSIAPGRIRVEGQSVEVDADALHRVIDEALYPHASPTQKIRALVDACRRLVSTAPFEMIEPLEEARDDPRVELACLPDSIAASLAAEVRRLFRDGEAELVLEAVGKDLRRDIPVLRITRQYRIERSG